MNLPGEEGPKPVDYYVTFEGRIINVLRPEGFPPVVHSSLVVRVMNKQALNEAINGESIRIIKQGGMVCNIGVMDEDPEGPSITGNRIFVPMHMLAYIRSNYKKMANEYPVTSAEIGPAEAEGHNDPFIS